MINSKKNRSHLYDEDVDPKLAERAWQLAADRLVDYDVEAEDVATFGNCAVIS